MAQRGEERAIATKGHQDLRGAGTSARPGATWAGRPLGVPAVVPPPCLPLSFLGASGLGLVACGVSLTAVATEVVATPTADSVVAAAQLGTLAVLSMGVLGALHQFVPVVSGRPLRSILLGWGTFVLWVLGAWLVPIGLSIHLEAMVACGGAAILAAVLTGVSNLAVPLAAKHTSVPVVGLRLGLLGFALTAASGATFIADRSGRWFELAGHVVLAHALVGVFFWIGIVYIAVAEKLWPMFLLAHLPGRHRSAKVAIAGVASGTTVVALGVWLGLLDLGLAGAVLLFVGLSAHVVSMIEHIANRRRGNDLHLVFVLTATFWLVSGMVISLLALTVATNDLERQRFAGAAIAAFAGWLLTALVGHAHKVVPFIAWTVLRANKKGSPTGTPLLFADLYRLALARAAYVLVTVGIAGVGLGLVADSSLLVGIGGGALAATGFVVVVNLSARPAKMVRAARRGGKA